MTLKSPLIITVIRICRSVQYLVIYWQFCTKSRLQWFVILSTSNWPHPHDPCSVLHPGYVDYLHDDFSTWHIDIWLISLCNCPVISCDRIENVMSPITYHYQQWLSSVRMSFPSLQLYIENIGLSVGTVFIKGTPGGKKWSIWPFSFFFA